MTLPLKPYLNPVKIFKLKRKDLTNVGDPYGIKFSFDGGSAGYYASSFIRNETNHGYIHVFRMIRYLYCGVGACSLGLVFFDKKLYGSKLNDQTKVFKVDYCVYITLETENNRFAFLTISYNDNRVTLSSCPYENWIRNAGKVKYEIAPHIRNNGYFESTNPEKTHIVTPIYPRKKNYNFFVCGVLKQPMLPDMKVGHKIQKSDEENIHEDHIDGLKDDFVCEGFKNISNLIHFGYLTNKNNYMGENFMEIIEVNLSKRYKLYSGEVILFYEKDKVEKEVMKEIGNSGFKEKGIKVDLICIRELVSTIKATLVPTIESLDFIKQGIKLNDFYIFVEKENLNRKLNIKCLSKIENDNDYIYDHFYSKAAYITVRKYQLDERIGRRDIHNIIVSRDMKAFGKYTCFATRKTNNYKSDYITKGNTYVLPAEGINFNFETVDVNKDGENNASCIQEYGKWSKLKSMEICCNYLNNSSVIITNFVQPNFDISIKNDNIIYNGFLNDTTVRVICKYMTVAWTTFTTKQEFKYQIQRENKLMEKDINDSQNISLLNKKNKKKLNIPNLSGKAGLMFCIIFITIISGLFILFKKRKKRRRDGNQSLLATGSEFTWDSKSNKSPLVTSVSTIRVKRK
uniref:Ig-like domain-containing protein n=1 Tax=Parastrongyloides trichosuri TaxID=131310 RepID=A0A0N4ZA67_PARTI